MTTKAMILASGRGERMMSLTKDVPKAMLKIGNVTLIEDKILRLSESGIQEIVINVGYLGNHIKDYVGDGSKYGIKITISDEGEMPIGTANGIRKVIGLFQNQPFIVVNADNILKNPHKMINKLCKRLNISFTKKMLTWPKGKRITDGIWSKVWYKNVELSNTFSKYKNEKIHVPKKYKKIYEESLKYYNEMNKYSL